VPFRVAAKTLERLEWPEILARLAACARTPRARARLTADPEAAAALFEAEPEGVRARLAETAEARALLLDGAALPAADLADPGEELGRARRGGVLAPRALLDLRGVLLGLGETQRLLAAHREAAPRLADLASTLADHRALAEAIGHALDPAGEVRSEASPALAAARRESRRLAAELEARLAQWLRDPVLRARLSDTYVTVRNDRYVLPVRADAQAGVPGIVHDASRSGTTLFIEPGELVELNNRHKQAELEIVQETLRVLRELGARAAASADTIETDLGTLAHLDLAFARARVALEQDASEPEVGDEGVIVLPLLRHPLIPPDEVVASDLSLGGGWRVLVLSGPNAGGKTVAMKAVALAALFARAGLFVTAGPGARVDLFDEVLADIGDEQDIREHLSTFSAHMTNLARITRAASPRSLAVLDEIGVGTDPGEGAALAQAILEALAAAGARVVATTHFNLLKEMAEVDPRFANASVELDARTLAPTYRLRMGLPGTSSATAVAARMGMPAAVLERADELLSREDRRLDRMLSELAASRAALEREQHEAVRLRAESEAVRAEYGERVERLRTRRDELYRSMRHDLDRAFRDAHGRVADVIRDLQQRGEGEQSARSRAQAAARAREALLALEAEAGASTARSAAQALPEAEAAEPGPRAHAPPTEPLDWHLAAEGDEVRLRDGGSAVLLALPDRHGRVSVRLGSARVLVPAERVASLARARRPTPPRVSFETAAGRGPGELGAGGARRCDLRGLRVDEALDRVAAELDRALAEGRERLEIVHGVGTGALRRAVREHLAGEPGVARVADAAPEQGGDGVTLAVLRE
jgi:DNA mismatch repair protein MutS2